jgi:hypothetical protein
VSLVSDRWGASAPGSELNRAATVAEPRRREVPDTMPLVMLQHFRGDLDNWDPALTGEREVILAATPAR